MFFFVKIVCGEVKAANYVLQNYTSLIMTLILGKASRPHRERRDEKLLTINFQISFNGRRFPYFNRAFI